MVAVTDFGMLYVCSELPVVVPVERSAEDILKLCGTQGIIPKELYEVKR